MTPRFRPRAAWPALGIAALIVFNAASDLRTGGPGLIGPGAFLHLAIRDGIPSGPLIDVLNYGATFMILAIGMTPVVATRGIDLSVGSIMAIAAAVAAVLSVGGQPPPVSIAAALGAAVVCGLWNGAMVSGIGLQPFVATLVLMVAGRGIAQLITDSQIITFHDPALEYIGLGRPRWLPLPFPFLIAVGLVGVTALLVRKTALGLLLEAVGGNPPAAQLAGVRSRRIIALTYGFSGLCAGIAGLIAAANIKAADPFNAGRNLELAAIFAVVVGGTPLTGGRMSLAGAAVGGLLMQTLTTTMYARNVGADTAPLPEALVILVVALVGAPRAAAWARQRWAR